MAALIGAGGVSLALLVLLTDDPKSATLQQRPKALAANAALLADLGSNRRPAGGYASLTRRNLFRPLVNEGSKRGARDANGKPLPGSLSPAGMDGFSLEALPGGAAAGLQGWSYIGSVAIDGVPFALLQNRSSGDAGYFRVGESLNGYRIKRIDRNDLVLSQPGLESIRIAKTSGTAATSARGSGTEAPRGGQVADSSSALSGPDRNAGQGRARMAIEANRMMMSAPGKDAGVADGASVKKPPADEGSAAPAVKATAMDRSIDPAKLETLVRDGTITKEQIRERLLGGSE